MNTAEIIPLLGALGLGGVVGIIIKSFLDKKLNDKKMLFDARVKAYSGITGRLFNLFLEPDITSLKEEALIWAKLNQLLSETMLMASHDLAELIGQYKPKVFEFHQALERKQEERGKILHAELLKLVGDIHVQMRKDLHVDDKSVFDKNTENLQKESTESNRVS